MMNAKVRLFGLLLLVCSLGAAWGQGLPLNLVTSDPVDGSLLNHTVSAITLTFNTYVYPSGVTVTRSGSPVAGAISSSGQGNVLLFTPTAVLGDGVYTVDFANVTSPNSGLPTGATSISFTVDTTPPSVVTSTPSAGQTGVPVTTQISLTFSEPLSEGDVSFMPVLTGPSGIVGLNVVSVVRNVRTYQPVAQLALGTTYTLSYSGAVDSAGNPVAVPSSFTFTTVQPTPLTLTSRLPAAPGLNVPVGSVIELQFGKPINLGASTVTVTGATPVSGILAAGSDPSILVFTPTSPLAYSSTYTVNFSGVRDTDGLAPTGATTFTLTTEAPPALALQSALPADAQTDVPVGQAITLGFSNNINAAGSTMVVRSGVEIVQGTLSAVGGVLTFTPTNPLRFSTEYTALLTGIRDIYGQAPTGVSQLSFRTEGGNIGGSVDPQMVAISANERVGVTYFLQNRTSQPITLRSSSAEFVINGVQVASVNVPAQVLVPANSSAALPSDVAISPQIQDAARDAGTDQVVMIRTFRSDAGAGSGIEVNVPLLIRVGSSLAGPASVTEIVLDVPPNGKTVNVSDEIRAHAFIRGTGTGAVVGTWFVDGRPTETFQLNMTAGLTQEASTRMTLPTLELGEHQVELKIGRPALVTSGERTYVVVPGNSASQRVFLLRPTEQVPLLPDAVRTSFRWAPMPGSSGYEIAFASSLEALGLDSAGNPLPGLINRQVWSKTMEDSGKLSLLDAVSGEGAIWVPTAEQYDKIFAGSPGTRYWAVRAIYPAQAQGDPTTTSRPRSVVLLPRPAALALVSPDDRATIAPNAPTFEWEQGPPGVTYELAIISGGRTAFKALTAKNSYTLSALSPFKLAVGDYSWRVSAVKPGAGLVAASERRAFTVATGSETSAGSRMAGAPAGATAVIIAGGMVVPLPGAASEIKIAPAHGETVSTQQPTISASFPESAPGGVLMTLNGVDVTSLATVTSTGITLQPPGVFANGDFTVTVAVKTASGQQIEETSKFTISASDAAAATSPVSGAADAAVAGEAQVAEPPVAKPLQLDFNWNWHSDSEAAATDNLTIDLNLRGGQTWVWRNGAYAAINLQALRTAGEKADMTNFLAEGGAIDGRYRAMVGDIGSTESELTAQGLSQRAFSFAGNTGPIKLNLSRSLGTAYQRSNTGNAPDTFLVTAENARSTPQQGLKVTYVDSESDMSASAGFGGRTKSKVLSFSGRTPIARTGLNLRAEVSNSDSTFISTFGEQGQKGSAVNVVVDGIAAGFGLSASYRRVDSDYFSSASATLANDLNGWTLGVNRPLTQYINTTISLSTLDNAGNSSAPASSVSSKAIDLTMAYPSWPALTFRVARNDASSDPFVAGSRPGDTRENSWSGTATYGNALWNAYVNYSNSDYDDFQDYLDPTLDTPNDRKNGTWAVGLAVQPLKSLKLRFDWGANNLDRWFRPLFAALPISGTDRSDQMRAQAEFMLNSKLSTSVIVTSSDYSDALGIYHNKVRDLSFRLNYFLKLTPAGGGVTLTGEYRRSNNDGNTFSNRGDGYAVLINDNRVMDF